MKQILDKIHDKRWGYKERYSPAHPNARINGCVLEHRLIAEKILKRLLKKNEVVHHRNNNKTDNVEKNIMVFQTRSDHARYHMTGIFLQLNDGTFISPIDKSSITCSKCSKLCSYGSKQCKDCRNKEVSKHIPNKEKLYQLVWSMPTIQVAKQFGVSDKAIEKWCNKYMIEKPPRGYWQKKRAKNK